MAIVAKSARAKVDNAKRIYKELQDVLAAYAKSTPLRAEWKDDSDARLRHYRVASVVEPPQTIAVLTGDMIHNLRCALDHMAYQLVMKGSAGSANPRKIYFPIGETRKDYEWLRDAKFAGAARSAVNAVDDLEPFKNGKGNRLWQVHELNNIDKHRLLLTVGPHLKHIDAGPLMQFLMQQQVDKHPGFEGDKVPLMSIPIRPADRGFPLKVGDLIYSENLDVPGGIHPQIVAEVAFGELSFMDDEPLRLALAGMGNSVENALNVLEPFL